MIATPRPTNTPAASSRRGSPLPKPTMNTPMPTTAMTISIDAIVIGTL
jgi:hypothetical protein